LPEGGPVSQVRQVRSDVCFEGCLSRTEGGSDGEERISESVLDRDQIQLVIQRYQGKQEAFAQRRARPEFTDRSTLSSAEKNLP
jgi:hypothetical protein